MEDRSMTSPSPLRLTLDTNCVIDAAQRGRYRAELDELVQLAQAEALQLSLTSAFENDQETASEVYRPQNLRWLQDRPVVGRIPQPFRFDISPLGDSGHVLAGGPDEAAVITKLEQIILAPQYQVGQLDANDSKLMARFRRRVADVQHLAGHMMSGNDYFVTSDHDDMLKKRKQIRHAAGIAIVDPPEAVALARKRL
jgi:hypothetical protein